MKAIRYLLGAMGWNLLWVPFPILVFLLLAVFDALEGYKNVRVLIEHWTWALLLSPAADMWFGLSLFSVVFPLQATVVIPAMFDPENTSAHPIRNGALSVIWVPALVFGIQILLWGCFPLQAHDGHIYMRLVPFIPWPSERFF
jgi:hypothetical protein